MGKMTCKGTRGGKSGLALLDGCRIDQRLTFSSSDRADRLCYRIGCGVGALRKGVVLPLIKKNHHVDIFWWPSRVVHHCHDSFM